jgi:hypothetical protein
MRRTFRQPRNRTVILLGAHARLKMKPGDTLYHGVTEEDLLVDNVTESADRFAVFSEWACEADEKAYGGL